MDVTTVSTALVALTVAAVDPLLSWYVREYLCAETPAERAAVCRSAQRDGFTGCEFTEALAKVGAK